MELRIDWTAETVDAGLDAFATALMLAGSGLPEHATVTQLRPYARALGDSEPDARTHVAWMIAGRVNEMLREADRRERLYRESADSPTWLLLTPEQASAHEGRPLEREPSALEGKRLALGVIVVAILLDAAAFIAPLAWVGEWLLLAIVVAFEIASTLVVRRIPRTRPILPAVSRMVPIMALAYTDHLGLAALVLSLFALTLGMQWLIRRRAGDS